MGMPLQFVRIFCIFSSVTLTFKPKNLKMIQFVARLHGKYLCKFWFKRH